MKTTERKPANSALTLTIVLILISLEACQTVPNIKSSVESFHYRGQPINAVDENGEAPVELRKKIIDGLSPDRHAKDFLQRHIAYIQSVTASPLIMNNDVQILSDTDETYPAMKKDIKAAVNHVNLETFIFHQDKIGQQFENLLTQKIGEGVVVNVIADGWPAFKVPAGFFAGMEEAGIDIFIFNPLTISRLPNINERDHRKILVIDGKVAYTGGINITSGLAQVSGRQGKLPWRDTHIRIEGPAVPQFQDVFFDTWLPAKGPPRKAYYYPPQKKKGNYIMQVLAGSPEQEIQHILASYLSAFVYARKSIHIKHAYFLPDKQLLEALEEAAKSGIDVQLVLSKRSDFAMPFYAGRYHFSRLLKAGIKIYERSNVVLHSKVAVVDGVWTTIGSSNLDMRSLLHDHEINAVVFGPEFGRIAEDIFYYDVSESDRILPDEWERRSLWEKIKESVSVLFSYWF